MKVSYDFKLKTARLISLLFVPPAATIIIFTWFALTLENETNQYVVLYVAYIFGFILPIALVLILRKQGRIVDRDATIKEERILPLVLGSVIYSAGLIILLFHHVNPLTLSFWFCYISNTIAVIFITRLWKISAHMLGVSGPFAAAMYVLGWPALLLAAVPFAVGWSRLFLKVHTPAQVLAGGLMGFASTYIQVYFFIRYLENGI